MASLFDHSRNYSLYTIPAAWLIALGPHAYAMRLSRAFDPRQPRQYVSSLKDDASLSEADRAGIVRAAGASANGFENLGVFAAAVVAGNLAGLHVTALNWLSAGYVASRLLYTGLYCTNTTEARAHARSVTYFAGMGLVITLFVKSANVLRTRPANLL